LRERAWGGGLSAFALSLLLLSGTAGDYGLTDDEPAYLKVEDGLARWFASLGSGSFDEAARTRAWVFGRKENRNLPVPALLALAGHALAPPGVPPLVRYRLGSCVLFSGTVGILFGLGLASWGFWPASVAAGGLLLMPQAFAHGHLNATDTAASCFFLLTLCLYGRSKGGWASLLVVGLVLGLGLGSKASLWVLPPVMALWMLVEGDWRGGWRLAVVLVTAALVWLLVCPMWWGSPVAGPLAFLRTSFGRAGEIWAIDSYYLGHVYWGSLPWHNGLVLPLVATPPLTLVLAGAGGVSTREGRLLAMGALVLPFLRMLPGTPGHDGVRLLLPSLYCLAPLAGLGFRRLVPLGRAGAGAAVFLLVSCLEVGLYHPFEISYYSELVGGLRGAAGLGFETTYWFDALNPRALREIQARLPQGASVWTFPSYPGYPFLRKWGLWREDLSSGGEGSAFLILYGRRASLEARTDLLRVYQEQPPLWAQTCQGVELVGLYRLVPAEASDRLEERGGQGLGLGSVPRELRAAAEGDDAAAEGVPGEQAAGGHDPLASRVPVERVGLEGLRP
jgi:hypothetical protein